MNLTGSLRGVSMQTRSLGGRLRARFLKREGGQALVEMALCLPVLLLIVSGIITFTVVLNNYLELSNAAAMGARALTASRGATDPCSMAATAIYQGAPFLKQSSLTISYAFYDKTGTSLGSGSGASCAAQAANLVTNGTAKLTLTYPCKIAVFGAQFWPGCKLAAQSTEYVQ